ncbi:MAG TPA: hypothetical protein VGJ87_07385, partial [Roseiflexaceae bacterium]
DPLAAVTIFDDRICRFEQGTVEVELASERLKGLTYWRPDGSDPRHEIAMAVDGRRFFDNYFACLQLYRGSSFEQRSDPPI